MPFVAGQKKRGGRKKGTPNRVTPEIRDAARRLLEDPDYQALLPERILANPHLEQLMFYYAYGRPVKRVEMAVETEPLTIVFQGEDEP